MSAPIETDALIVGAGPVGLFQAFQLGLQGLSAHIADVLPVPGGQCAALYPLKPIYDIPGVPLCTGAELTERLLAQVRPFAPVLHLGHEVCALEALDETPPRWRVTLRAAGGAPPAAPLVVQARFVFIAAGIGAFQPKPLRVPGLEAWLDRQVFHHPPEAPHPAAGDFGPQGTSRLVILGGEETAVDWALRLAGSATPARVTIIHRRAELQAEPAQRAALDAALCSGRVRLVVGQPTGVVSHGEPAAGGRLSALQVSDIDDHVQEVAADHVLVCQGLSPKLGPLADWDLGLERKQVPVDTARFATRLPGVYAVGDINTYPGKRKLILCGFHEATLAAFDAASAAQGGAPVPLEYTTSSSRLHRRLGLID